MRDSRTCIYQLQPASRTGTREGVGSGIIARIIAYGLLRRGAGADGVVTRVRIDAGGQPAQQAALLPDLVCIDCMHVVVNECISRFTVLT
jgi:hypothetical protein